MNEAKQPPQAQGLRTFEVAWRSAPLGLRGRAIETLLRPLGTLGRAAVASGAFLVLMQPRQLEGLRSGALDASAFSFDQVLELASFVQQVDPATIVSVVSLLVR